MNWFKEKPLSFQIWIILGLVLGVSFLLLTVLFQVVLSMLFTSETYNRLEEVQEYILKSNDDLYNSPQKFLFFKDEKMSEKDHSRSVFRLIKNVLIHENGELMNKIPPPDMQDVDKIREIVKNQQKEVERHTTQVGDKNILFISRQVKMNKQIFYLVSYLPGLYRDNMVETTLSRLLGIMVFVLLISWVASIFITRYLTRPLMQLKTKVDEIAKRRWNNPVKLDRKDEIGQLGEAIETMRRQLIENHRQQQSFLQQVSHELKTPIMVIRSYARSIQEGIFPVDNLENSLEIIEDETERLEKRVHSLLNISKLDYLAYESFNMSLFNFSSLLRKVIKKFIWRKTELDWDVDIKEEPIIIKADKDKITVVLENIFDNQIRYAESLIKVRVINRKEGYILLRIWNDGPHINEETKKRLFTRFNKGDDGQFGLGLAIVKTIVNRHRGKIWTENEEEGVAFYIEWRGIKAL